MSLSWELKKVEDWENKCFLTAEDGQKQLHPVTHVIVLATTFVGVPEITKETALEFAKRIRLYQGVFGALMRRGSEPHYLSAADIINHIGLKTNASKDSRATFIKRVWSALDSEVKYETKREPEQQATV